MSNLAAETSVLAWYEDPARLREKREELGVSVSRLAKAIGRHRSYVEEIESGRITLRWQDNGELLWNYLIGLELSQGETASLAQMLKAPTAGKDEEL